MSVVGLALVVGIVAVVVIRGFSDDRRDERELTVTPDVVSPGDWVTVTGGNRYGYEGYLDRIDDGRPVRTFVLYPSPEPRGDPPSVDLRDEQHPGLRPINVGEALRFFKVPEQSEPGPYRFCRISVSAKAELCANVTIVAKS